MSSKMKSVCVLLFLLAVVALAASTATVDDAVRSAIAAGEKPTVLLHFNNGKPTSRILDEFREIHRPFERSIHPDVLPNLMMANSDISQASIIESLQTWAAAAGLTSLDLTPLWIVNRLAVRNVDNNLLNFILTIPAISRVQENKVYQLLGSFETSQSRVESGVMAAVDNIQENVAAIHADKMWESGCDGTNVRIGSIDTGVRGSHISLKDNYVGKFGWFDGTYKNVATIEIPGIPPLIPAISIPVPGMPAKPRSQTPNDDNGHGTHVMGTAAGANGIGVAPNATWMACKGLDKNGAGTEGSLILCGQFMMCPTDANGNEKNCSMKPDIVFCSWGTSSDSDHFYDDIIRTWVLAGIIPVFANGNGGPDCMTTGSPAYNTNCISVGSTDKGNTMSIFSSRGPVKATGAIKPDVSAPGREVVSASGSSDTGVVTLSGTSMATPAVAGIFGCTKSCWDTTKGGNFTFQVAKELLKTSTTPVIGITQTCGGISGSTFPNCVSGWGIINGLELIRLNSDTLNLRATRTSDPVENEEQVEIPVPPPTPAAQPLSLLDVIFQLFKTQMAKLGFSF